MNNIIPINRSQTFNPTPFIGEEGCIVIERDERSLTLTEVDLGEIELVHMLQSSENSIKGEDFLNRLKKYDGISLDAMFFCVLWKNQSLIPSSWKKKAKGITTYIIFPGTLIQRTDGNKFVLCLYWKNNKWDWYYLSLKREWREFTLSVMLRISKPKEMV